MVHKPIYVFTLIALSLGCGEVAREDEGRPPPEGYPQLASRFEVTASVLSTDCAFQGFTLGDALLEASVFTDRASVEWRQPADGDRVLSGALCPDGDVFRLRLRGGHTAREVRGERVCEVRSTYAPSPCGDLSVDDCAAQAGCAVIGSRCAAVSDVCEDPHAMDLLVEACGALEGTFEVELDARRDCPSEPCRARVRWRALPEGGRCD